MQISELGNLSLGASSAADVRARARSKFNELDKATKGVKGARSTVTKVPARKPSSGTMTMGPVTVTPKTAAQAVAVNDMARSEKERKQFVEDLIKASDNAIYDMIKAVAQETKVGGIEFAMVKGYSAEIAGEARRRFGDQKAKELLDAAYIKSPAAVAAAAPASAVVASTVTDPLAPVAQDAAPGTAQMERGVTINSPAEEKAMGGGFLQQYGMVIGIGAVALVALGFLFFSKPSTTPAPAPMPLPPAIP